MKKSIMVLIALLFPFSALQAEVPEEELCALITDQYIAAAYAPDHAALVNCYAEDAKLILLMDDQFRDIDGDAECMVIKGKEALSQFWQDRFFAVTGNDTQRLSQELRVASFPLADEEYPVVVMDLMGEQSKHPQDAESYVHRFHDHSIFRIENVDGELKITRHTIIARSLIL